MCACGCFRKSRGRHAGKYTEEMEDADLLKDEAANDVVPHRLSQQPSVIKHGIMREYQMQGLNWLIHLYDNGINGILADEMVCHLATCPCTLSRICCAYVSQTDSWQYPFSSGRRVE